MSAPSGQPPHAVGDVGIFQALAASMSASTGNLALDLIGGQDVLKLSFPIVAGALARRVVGGNDSKLAKVVPFVILASGAYGFMTTTPLVLFVSGPIKRRFQAEITILGSSSLNKDVLAWLTAQGLGAKATSLVHDEDDSDEQLSLGFVPHTGTFTFRHEGHKLTMSKKPVEKRYNEQQQAVPSYMARSYGGDDKPAIIISTWNLMGSPVQIIKSFLRSVKGSAKSKKDKSTRLYQTQHTNMDYNTVEGPKYQPSRKMDSVALKSVLKSDIVGDITKFLAPGAEQWHVSRGFPYRRGYLLYGPPGTGKTSFARAIAGQWDLPLFVITMGLPNLDDCFLERVFEAVPKRAVVLLEDIDVCAIQRGPQNPKKSPNPPLPLRSRPTLSGLLNCIDGPASRDGRILIMTTNDPDSLDAALIRPGRCDKKILFGYACAEVAKQLFTHVYSKTPDELAKGAVDDFAHLDIAQLAADFAAAIPHEFITPAEANSYLLEKRDDPLVAVAGAQTFFAQIAETKARGANVSAFANEIKKTDGKGEEKEPTGPPAAASSSPPVETDGKAEGDLVGQFVGLKDVAAVRALLAKLAVETATAPEPEPEPEVQQYSPQLEYGQTGSIFVNDPREDSDNEDGKEWANRWRR